MFYYHQLAFAQFRHHWQAPLTERLRGGIQRMK